MTDGADIAVQEAQGELSLARIALADGDLHHAATHLTGAISFAPALAEVHELLAVLATRGEDGGLSLFPLEDRCHVATVVAHAHLLARRSPAQALTLLAQASEFDPEKPWADVSWVRAIDPASLDPDVLAQVFVKVMRGLGDPAPEPLCRTNEVYLDLARRATTAHPHHALVHATAAGIARRLGQVADAVRWGERAVDLEPSKLSYVWYAYALKADDQLDRALDVMRTAYQQNPLDLDLCSDMASWLADAGRWDEAQVILDEAISVDPSYDCVVYTSHRLRFERDGDPAHLIALVDFARENPQSHHHRHADLADCCRGLAWLGRIDGPTEACVNALAQLPRDQHDSLTSLSLSALEVPSAIAVLRRASPRLTLEIAGPPPADMVNPLRPGRVLWRYDGVTEYPALEPASPHAVELLSRLAAPSWPDPISAYDHALPLGDLPAEELLALLVHPPVCPPDLLDMPVGWWERCAQIFTCLGILHCRELGEGHPGDTTAQRRVLTEIAYGIEDWTTEAALFALTVAAWLDPSCRNEVRDIVGTRFLEAIRASRHRVVTILGALAELVRIVPGMPTDVISLANNVIAAREQVSPASAGN